MLEFIGRFQDESQFTSLLEEEISEIKIGDVFARKAHTPNNYIYKINFYTEDSIIFAFYKWNKFDPNYHGSVKTQDYFCFYSEAFRKIGMDWVVNLIKKHYKYTHSNPVKRVDICLDIPFPTTEIANTFNQNKTAKRSIFYWENKQIETLNIWEKQFTKNRLSFIRIYDKLIELYKSWKARHYTHYFNYENMTRIEIEIRRELCKNITLEEIVVLENQYNIFITHIKKHSELFNHFVYDKIRLFKKRESKDWESLTSIERKKRIKLFYWLATRIGVELGLCPVRLLLWKDIYLGDTINSINERWIIPYIKLLKASYHWDKNINSALDKKSLYESDKWR